MDPKPFDLTFNSNLSLVDRSIVCSIAYSFRRNPTIISLLLFQISLSFLTLYFLYLLFKTKKIKKIWALIDLDLKIIVVAGVTFYILGALDIFFLYSYKLIILLLNFEECFYVWDGTQCYALNYIFNMACTPAFCLFHLALFIERCYVSFKKGKEEEKKSKGTFGIVMAAIIVIPPMISNSLLEDSSLFADPRVYCGTLYSAINPRISASVYGLIGFEFIMTFLHFLLFLYNRFQIKRQKRNMSNFNLNHSFQLRQISLSISVIYPYSVAHFLTYSLSFYFFVIYGAERLNKSTLVESMEFVEKSNAIRVFSTFLLICFLYIQNTVYHSNSNILWPKADEGDQHFRQIRRMFA